MKNEKVLKFAQRSGYATVNYLGKYKEFDLAGLEIQKYRVQQKNTVQ